MVIACWIMLIFGRRRRSIAAPPSTKYKQVPIIACMNFDALKFYDEFLLNQPGPDFYVCLRQFLAKITKFQGVKIDICNNWKLLIFG